MTNEAGSVTDTLVFDAFGNETTKSGTTDNSYGFKGEEKDETGLYYLRARYMDPVTGTFTSMDTYGGSLTDPMSLHKYLFANANPVMNSDPSGHFTLTEENICAAIDSALQTAVMDCLEWLVTDPECEKQSFWDHVGGILADSIVSGFLGCAFSVLTTNLNPGVDGLWDKLKGNYKSKSPKKLSYNEKMALVAIPIWGMIAIPVGYAFKEAAQEEDDVFYSNFLNSLGDLFLDPYYNFLAAVFNCPPGVVSGYFDGLLMVKNIGKS